MNTISSNRRQFIATVMALSIAPGTLLHALQKTEKRILSCPWSELTGLYCKLENGLWRIGEEMPDPFLWKGQFNTNRRRDYWKARNVETGQDELFCFSPLSDPERADLSSDWMWAFRV